MRRTAGVVRDHQGVKQANVILCMILHIRCSRCGGTSVKRQRKEPRLSAASCERVKAQCIIVETSSSQLAPMIMSK